MKNLIYVLLPTLFYFFVVCCSKPTKITPERKDPIEEEPEKPTPLDTVVIEKPAVDTTLYDTSRVPLAKGFEALLIKKGIIKDILNDGLVLYGQIKDIDSINLRAQLYDHYNFTSIRGIHYFKKLKYLNVYGSYLGSLDLSKNTLLEYVNCQGITGSGIQDNKTIKYINVSTCKELQHLDCAFNLLTKLDVSQNPKLRTLICHRNNLSELDISNNTDLRILDCRFNERITRLATDRTVKLTKLAFAYNSITEPLLEKLVDLKELDCSFNISSNSFSTISLKNNVNLETLDISGSKLTQIDLCNNINITTLDVCCNRSLKKIDLNCLSKLKIFRPSYSYLESLDLSLNKELEVLAIDGTNLETLNFQNNPKLKMLFCKGSPNLSHLNISMCKELTVCLSSYCPKLKSICVYNIPAKNAAWETSEWTQYVTDCN